MVSSNEFTFNVGDTVHYPEHGICTIKTIFYNGSSSVQGHTYVLKPINATFEFQRLLLPHKKAVNIGVHYLINKEEVPKIYEVLKEKPTDYSHSRIRGYIETKEKLDSGDFFKIAEATRDLDALNDIISLFLRARMLRAAKNILIAEAAVVENISKKDAEDKINKALLMSKEA
jgi:RNA polymerase-interacting CarD/CdnL/TRCF family regulator